MSVSKRVLKHPRVQTMLGWLLAMFIRFVYISNLKHWHVAEAAKPYLSGEHNALYAFWHGRMMMLPAIDTRKRGMHVLISHHRDGRLISSVIGQFGEKTVSGSSSRGGMEAVRRILQLLDAGDNISMTPDGPRGPLQVASPGIAGIAAKAGKPVVPVTFSATRHRRLKSWDRFMLALPFGRIVFCIGEPLLLQSGEDGRLALEQAMNALVEQADSLTHA